MAVPTISKMYNPLLRAIHELGGSASKNELENKVAEHLNLSEADIQEPVGGKNLLRMTKFSHRLGWARTLLKSYGIIDNSKLGIWALTEKGQNVHEVDEREVGRIYDEKLQKRNADRKTESKMDPNDPNEIDDSDADDLAWEDEALSAVKDMKPDAFERLCQRLLREAGFVQVEVTGKSGDGGIDGRGVIKLGLLSFHAHFQCKRYKDSVPVGVVRDFRGAMVGRADKGIIMTTGTFTREARGEALRDGAPPLDLVDGTDLVKMLKTYELGISEKQRIDVEVNREWFERF